MDFCIRVFSFILFAALFSANSALAQPQGGLLRCVSRAPDGLLIRELENRGYSVTWEEPEEEVYVARIATCEVGADLTYPGDDAGGTVTLWNHVRNSLGTVVISEELGTYNNSRYLSDNTKSCVGRLSGQTYEIPPSFIVECKCTPRQDHPTMANLKVNVRSSDYMTYLFQEQVIASFGSSSYLSDNTRYCEETKAKIRYCSQN